VSQGPDLKYQEHTDHAHRNQADVVTASRVLETEAIEQWLTVHEACALIGVSPATLRRWSAAGDVQAFTTPGGHRRFARSTILGLLPSARRQRPTLERLGETPEHMTRVYRRHVAQACEGVSWLAGLSEDELEPLREHGRRIAGALLVLIDAATPQERRPAMLKAVAAATEYGRIAARGSGQLRETVEAFLRFRMLFLGELAQVARRRGLDTSEATNLLVTATQAIDQLLVALMSGHETELAKNEHVKG
jgi:excisionase family DNA binding protein